MYVQVNTNSPRGILKKNLKATSLQKKVLLATAATLMGNWAREEVGGGEEAKSFFSSDASLNLEMAERRRCRWTRVRAMLMRVRKAMREAMAHHR